MQRQLNNKLAQSGIEVLDINLYNLALQFLKKEVIRIKKLMDCYIKSEPQVSSPEEINICELACGFSGMSEQEQAGIFKRVIR